MPANHRAARGEELLGLLLDLDEGRTRPSLRQGVGVFSLALRLRLSSVASLLLAAFLVGYGTHLVTTAYDMGTEAITVTMDREYPIRSATLVLLILTALRLTIAVAWILDRRRTALAACAGLLVYQLSTTGVDGLGLLDIAVALALGIATGCRWPAPRPRIALLATIPVAMLLWTLIAARDLSYGTLGSLTAALTLLGAACGLLPRRPSRAGNRFGTQDEPGHGTRPTPGR